MENDFLEKEKEKYRETWRKEAYKYRSPECQKIWDIIPWLKRKPIYHILVAGCGEGFGAYWLSKEGFAVTGLDIVNVIKFPFRSKLLLQEAPLWETHLQDKEFDAVIAIDVLEHITEEKINASLEEIRRISRFFYFNISCREDSLGKKIGKTLHLCVKPPDWWYTKINEIMNIEGYAGNKYELKIMGITDKGEG